MDIRKEIEFFDNFEHQHSDYDVLSKSTYDRLIMLLKRRTGAAAGQKCIEMGCGTGAFTSHLVDAGLKVTGIDISSASTRRAEATVKNARFLAEDIRKTTLPAACADIIVFSGVLHHLTTEEDRRMALEEATRLLRPEGFIFAYDPNGQSPPMWLYRDPRSPLYTSKGKTENEIVLRRKQLAAELQAVNYRDIIVEATGGITFRYVDGKGGILLPLYNTYDRLLALLPIQKWIGTFIITSARRPSA